MNNNDIIKALKQCAAGGSCRHCPLEDELGCRMKLLAFSLEIINRQKAENESLGESVRLQAEMLYDARAEAIKEFAERLKENISNMEYTADVKRKTVPIETLFAQVNWVFHEIVPETIDKLAKEMMEEHHAEID